MASLEGWSSTTELHPHNVSIDYNIISQQFLFVKLFKYKNLNFF